jgi:hypothetical protein
VLGVNLIFFLLSYFFFLLLFLGICLGYDRGIWDIWGIRISDMTSSLRFSLWGQSLYHGYILQIILISYMCYDECSLSGCRMRLFVLDEIDYMNNYNILNKWINVSCMYLWRMFWLAWEDVYISISGGLVCILFDECSDLSARWQTSALDCMLIII